MIAAAAHGREEGVPTVSVILPVYNAGEYLRAAVLSILQQTYQDWEMLIIDDGSTDNAFDALVDIEDPRIRIMRDGTNKGLAARLNEGISLARGRYFARMDQDDISYPARLARQVETLESNPDLDLVSVRSLMISPANEVVGIFPHADGHDMICARPWRGFYLPHPTWVGRIEWFRKYRYAIPGPYLCEDQDLLTRSYASSRFAIIPETLFAYRVRRNRRLGKIFRIRSSVMRMQLRNFMREHQYRYALLAVLFFVIRLTVDVLNAFLPPPLMVGKYNDQKVDEAELVEWEKIKGSLGRATRRQLFH